MRFSIIVPVYNVERYLGDCISSVLDQTYKDFELILIDDGSSDHSGELCEQFATQDTRIVVIHKENGGLSSARNAGLVAAQGDNIIFLDSDDYWNSEVLLEEIVQADCDGIVCWNYTRVEENLARKMNNDRHEIRPFRLSQDYAYLLGSKRLFASACFYAIPAHFFRESDLEFETGVLSEDVEWFARLLVQVERIAIINGQPYSYRLRKGSISNSVSEKHVIDLKRHLSKIQELISTVEQSKQEYLETYLAEQIANYIIVISSRSDWQKYSLDLELRRAKLSKCLSRRSRIINTSCQIIGIKGTILLLRLVKRITKK